MHIKPENFSDRPNTDTLSLLLADIHMKGGSYVFSEFGAPWSFRMHTPDIACFHIILQGNAWLRMLPDGEPILLKQGELIVFPQGSDHIVFSGQEGTPPFIKELVNKTGKGRARFFQAGGEGEVTQMICGYFRFDMMLARPLLNALPLLLHLQSTDGASREWLTIGIHFMMQETLLERPAHQAIVNRIFDLMFIECMRDYVENLPIDSLSWLNALRDPYLSRALSAIHRYPAAAWTLDLLAQEAGLSRSSLASRFSTCLKQGVMEYLTAYRMRLVTWWLQSSSLTLSRIADKVGYSSEAALSQAFKREIGCSPGQYRTRTNNLQDVDDAPF